MRKPSLVIGLHGTKMVGKDTLFKRLTTLNPRFVRQSFADRLKQDIAPLIREQFGFDPDNLTPDQKELVRPLWIAYGMAWRQIDPLHWVKVVTEQIDQRPVGEISVVADMRFMNEFTEFRRRYNQSFLLVDIVRNGAPPPTEEEEKHFRQVAAMADYHLVWGNDSEQEQLDCAREVMRWIGVEENR